MKTSLNRKIKTVMFPLPQGCNYGIQEDDEKPIEGVGCV